METQENQAGPGPAVTTPQAWEGLPRYRSHKVVEAALIVAVQLDVGPEAGNADLILDARDGRDQFVHKVDAAYVQKHKPAPGSYYVRYADGYESLSPAEAFESGYVPEPAVSVPPPNVRRVLTGHQVNGANEKLVVEVLDDKGSGGAHHLYRIRGFDSGSNPSCPFKALYGAPARHSTVLFQNGPIAESGVNGVTHEALLAILEDRLACFQDGPFACGENAMALEHIRQAQRFLQARTSRRVEAGTEGTHKGT